MFIVGMLSWWYGAGWQARASIVRERIERTMDYFSIDILLRTLFAPYRQIAAGRVDGPLAIRWQAFVDKAISRLMGSIIRLILIIVGSFAVVAQVLSGCIVLLLWAFVPLLPLVGFVLYISGWVPLQWK